MRKEIMEENLIAKLERNLNLTKAQVEYVKENIESDYENDCELCRINVLMYFGLSFAKAERIVNEL